VRVVERSGANEAYLVPRRDGTSPIMVLARNPRTGRHTALDAHIVLHEYVHGVTSRLVGGPQNAASLAAPQSQALGEGWSDYYALTVQNHLHDRTDTGLGAWSSGLPGGLRGLPYDDAFAAGFGDIGCDRFTEPHAVGEIWAAMLIRLHRELGAERCWRLVLDALHHTPMEPTLLDARDGLLRAAADLDRLASPGEAPAVGMHTTVRRFAARAGMGRTATCRNGPDLTGISACSDDWAD
jgi:extracellular elastinolytic metalloproteinase